MGKVQVLLGNDSARIYGESAEDRQALKDELSFFWPAAPFQRPYKLHLAAKREAQAIARRHGRELNRYELAHLPGWNGVISMFKNGVVSAGVFRATKAAIQEKYGIEFEVTYDRPKVPPFLEGIGKVTDPKYSYQDDCVEAMQKAMRRGGGTILAATGSGKTATVARLFSTVACKCLFVVDRLDLLYQSQAEIRKWLGEEVGMVGDSEFQIQRVTVATRQTLKKHLKKPHIQTWLSHIGVVIVDELHVQMGKSNFDILKRIHPIARYGLTATLQMKKKDVRMNVWAFSGPVIFQFPLAEGQKAGVLSEGSAIQLLFPYDDGGYKEAYRKEYTHNVTDNREKILACSSIVRYLLRQGRFVIVLAWRIEHVENLHKEMRDIPHRVAYGKVKAEKRVIAKKKFEKGDIRLIIASNVFERGVDIKRVDALIDMAELPGRNAAVQKFGRGVRIHIDKKNLLYIDIGTIEGRLRRAANSRIKALTSAGIPTRIVRVETAARAVHAVLKRTGGGQQSFDF